MQIYLFSLARIFPYMLLDPIHIRKNLSQRKLCYRVSYTVSTGYIPEDTNWCLVLISDLNKLKRDNVI